MNNLLEHMYVCIDQTEAQAYEYICVMRRYEKYIGLRLHFTKPSGKKKTFLPLVFLLFIYLSVNI